MIQNKTLYSLAGALLAAGVLLAGCAKEKGGTEPAARSAITIEASIGTPTKVAYDGDAAAFEDGDQISLYAWMGSAEAVPEKKIVDGVLNTFDGSVWTPETQMLWSHVKENHYFLGVYPPRQITDFTADDYTLGDDLMIATELTGIPFKENAEPVKLSFTHALARIDVNLRFRNQWEQTPEVTRVSAYAKREYTVNYLGKEVTATGDNFHVSIPEVSAVTGYQRSFSGLQVPQNGVTKVSVLIGGNEFVFTAAQPISLESGKVTTLNLYVGTDKLELASLTVAPWVDKEPIQGGEALIPVTGISFKEGTSGNLDAGKTMQLTPVLTPEGATDVDCTWSSSNPAVATVSETGLVTALKPGTTTIRCTCSGKTVQYALTVIGIDPVYTAPTAKTGLVYNGTAQSLLNGGTMTTEGPEIQYSLNQTSWSTTVPTSTNAGSYKVYWRIPQVGKYNGVASTKIEVAIAKATPTFSLSSTAVSFSDTDAVDATKTVTVTYDGDGTLSATSSATGKVTASINKKTITLTRKDKAAGSVNITVSAGAGANYNAPASSLVITVTLAMLDEGTYLMNAADGSRLGSNGKAYASGVTMPDGVTVVGAVIKSKRVVIKKDDEAGAVTAVPTSSSTYGLLNVYINNLTTATSKSWEINGHDNYDSWGMNSTANFSTLNGYLTTAGCTALSSTRHYGALQGWVYIPQNQNWENGYSSHGPVYLRACFIF